MNPELTRERLADTDHGRSEGWDLELDGRVVALLDEPRWEDMFWISYRITPTCDDPALAANLLTEQFWEAEHARFVFRSRALGLPAAYAFPAGGGFLEPARVNMRGLYVLHPDDRPAPAPAPDETLVSEQPHTGILGRLWRRLTGSR